jgi:hypothetical protein
MCSANQLANPTAPASILSMTPVDLYEVIHHTETTAALTWVVFVNRNGKLERATHLGKRGAFATREAAERAALNATQYGTQNV